MSKFKMKGLCPLLTSLSAHAHRQTRGQKQRVLSPLPIMVFLISILMGFILSQKIRAPFEYLSVKTHVVINVIMNEKSCICKAFYSSRYFDSKKLKSILLSSFSELQTMNIYAFYLLIICSSFHVWTFLLFLQ